MIDPAELCKLIAYEPKTGALTWRARPFSMFKTLRDCKAWNTLYAGKPALAAHHGAGYLHGSIHGQHVLAHRVAWAIAHGEWPNVIDHINGQRADNRLRNLRSVETKDNLRNQGLQARNQSGVVGVHKRKQDGRWLANILVDGKTRHLGLFDTMSEAAAARQAAERVLGYHRNHGKRPCSSNEGGEVPNKASPVAA